MNKTRHYIRTLLLMLLLLAGGGTGNEAWAKKVTYHILTKPFTVRNYNNTGDHQKNIRVEALQCTSEESTVGLPAQFKSPLATNFRYWKTATLKEYNYLYDYTHNNKIVSSKYNIYQCEESNAYACLSNEIENPENTSTDADGFPNDIYVTYDYVNDVSHEGYSLTSWRNDLLELNGETDYNVTVNISNKQRFMCFNRSRNNRVANALGSALTGEQLVDDNFVVPENGKSELGWSWGSWGPIGIHLGFKFLGEDPYNITIMTSYLGDEVHVSDAITGVDVTPYSSTNQNKATIKPYKGATLFGKLGNTQMWFDASNDRHYKVLSGCGQNDWKDGTKYQDCKTRYEATPEQARYDTWVGFYRNETPTMNSYALLPYPNGADGEYLFVGSKMNQGDSNSSQPTIYQPNKSGYYALYNDNSNNPCFKFQAFSNAYKTHPYEIRTYTLHIKTHGSKTELPTITMKWSDAMASDKIVDHIPEALKRKYCSYKAYSKADLKDEITTFADAIKNVKDANGKIDITKLEGGKNIAIWLDYTVLESLPFNTLPDDGVYTNAQWYTMRMNGKAEQKNIAYNSSNSLITGSTSIGSESDLHYGETYENSANAMVAFIGDPYELKIISRAASESASANRYVGYTGATDNKPLNTNKEDTNGNSINSNNIITWEIVYENTDMGNFVLRQFGTSANPKYIGWNTSESNKPVTYSSTSSRIRVVELERVSYTYYIVRNNAGDIAVKASASHDVGKALSSWEDIPEVIRSPFLKDGEVTFYGSLADATTPTNAITNAPYDSNRNIFVRYVVSASGEAYNLKLNNDYIYTEGEDIKSKSLLNEGDANTSAYKWILDYSDPYNMTIINEGITGKYLNVTFGNDVDINWSEIPSYFVAKSGAIAGTYEVMAATGNSVDASETYYNIGRPAENTVKLYSNSSYQYGNAVLRFQLIATDASDVVYHLIDKAGKDLLQVNTRQKSTDQPSFPPEYHSPLVSSYYYYSDDKFSKDGDVYTLITPNELKKVDEVSLSSDGKYHIYVTYKVNDLVNLKSGQLYLLKYEAGEEFRQEDGSNGLLPDPEDFTGTDEEKTARYKAVYPYVNGDGNFFVYGENERELQQASASTRTRWVWYVQSPGDEGDPYHVTIKSYQDEPFPYINYSYYNAYFMTYMPAGYSKVVTTLAWPGMSEETATEYMVLGSEGQYQLVTTYEIEGSRHVVNSFEQYWKTWDTIRKIIYGESSAKEKDSDPIIIPNDTKYPYENPTEETLRDYLENTLKWHSYEKWAYAKRWNGYNNGYSTTTGTPDKKKGWETIEHWYQTVKMGEGYFDFVKTSVDPVLILLDQHGWEIMRKPLPSSPDDPLKDAKYEAIRAYNSPMVKEYKFYSDNTKATGYHKYIPKTPITVDGKQYVSTSLTSLPPYETAVNVKDKKGNLNDQYVTYTVKDEYAQAYSCTYAAGVASEMPKPFLIQQGNHFVSESGDAIATTDVPAGGMNQYITENIGQLTESGEKKNELWYIRPNRNIDTEMGMSYGTVTDITKKEPWTQDVTETYYETNHLNGFDPYNIQIQSVSKNTKYLVTNAIGAIVVEGSMEATYKNDSPTISLDTQANVPGAGTDNTTLHMTNATFMAVQDENGNMQLMPRFDHSHRMSDFSTLTAPTDVTTYTKLYRPVVYDYRIIDNDGHESLRYQSGGDLLPQTPDHFKSPLAKNFKYYATADDTYKNFTNEITESLDGANLENDIVYIRYEYDEDADNLNILKGNWLTMQLDNKTTQYTTVSTPGIYSSLPSYSSTANVGELDNQAKKLTETGDYYFKVGNDYYKVTVTNIVGETFATYDTPTDATFGNWDDSTEKLTAADNADLEYQAKRLTEARVYYFRVGTSDYTYKEVNVKSAYIASYAEYTSTPEVDSSNWDASKPLVVNADGKKWQWKFLKNQQIAPDPYAVYLFNRDAKDVELPNSSSRFAILSHKSGDYALAKAGVGTVVNYDYTYQFLKDNGEMSTGQAAVIATESGFTCSTNNVIGTNSQVKLTDEGQYAFTYKIYTNDGKFAIKADQTQAEAENNDWATRIPDDIKTPLLNLNQFLYYSKDDVTFGTGEPGAKPTTDIASIDEDKNLSSLYGLYGEEIVVRYTSYDPSVTEYQVPNVRNAVTTDNYTDKVAKGIGSNDAPLDLSQTLIYNVIWYNDNMMFTSDDAKVEGHANQAISMDTKYEWKIGGNDPYAMKFYNVHASDVSVAGDNDGRYITAASTEDDAACTLAKNATTFMLLPKANYDYGILAITGNKDSKLTIPDNGTAANDDAKITTGDPAEFIIFALSTHKVIYHLMIRKIGDDIIVPYYRGTDLNGTLEENKKVGTGSTLRDLDTYDETGSRADHPDGDLYQLGETLKAIGVRAAATTATGLYAKKIDNGYGTIYCYDAGHISLGDKLEVPSVFYRPNVKYRFIVEGVYDSSTGEEVLTTNDKYKGWETDKMGDDEGLLHNTVFVNIVYSFDADLGTNTGSGFVTKVGDNKWYSFDTNDATPQLAQYTGSLQTKSGYATHYTNDYLWTPVGDPYGFKMYNRYAYKNQGETNLVMTTTPLEDIANGQAVMMGNEADNKERDIYELIANSTTTPGYFRVHPMMNKSGIQYYMNCNSSTGALTLSTTPTEWKFGLSEDMMRPYREAAGYVGGLNAAGKAKYEEKAAIEDQFNRLIALQDVVYNHDNDGSDPGNPNYIVHYTPGYYRLHSQPGSSDIPTPRYASGYTHKIELTDGPGAIPLHFYEVPKYTFDDPVFSDLGIANTDYTGTAATRGDIPLVTVDKDPASIFYFAGEAVANPSSTMQTQELYVVGDNVKKTVKMTETPGEATSFSIIDIGAGVIALQSGDNFLNYNQNSTKYDLKFNTATELSNDGALESTRWCMQPVQKDYTAGDGEMGLQVLTNDDGKGSYLTTFYAPFDVLLTNEKDEAFVLPELPDGGWPTTKTTIHLKKIGQYNTAGTYAGKSNFIPARTPVIIRTSNKDGYVTMALPILPNPTTPAPCVFSGKYLEQMLNHGSDYVYAFGKSLGTYTLDENFATNGLLSPHAIVSTDVGFYINANPEKEIHELRSKWTRNNKYVYGNKIYYLYSPPPGDSRELTRSPEFIPVVFDDEENEEDEPIEESLRQQVFNGCVYDLQGRCVATEEMVKDGTWRHNLKHGIYILNGKKVYVK